MADSVPEKVEATRPAFAHFSVVADGVLERFVPGHDCQPGPAFLSLKVWAVSGQHAVRVAQAIGKHVGFRMMKAEVYQTEPTRPSGDKPFGYDLYFSNYDAEVDPTAPANGAA